MKTKLIILCLLLLFSFVVGADTIKFEKTDASSPEAGVKKAINMGAHWVGYHITSKFSNKSNHYCYNSDTWSGKTLHEYVFNSKPESRCSCGSAVFFRLKGRKSNSFDSVKVINYSRCPDFMKNSKVVWINRVDFDSSVQWLSTIYNRAPEYKIRKALVLAMGIHGTDSKVLSFLKRVVKSDKSEKIRKNGTFWTGCQKTPEAVNFLKTVVNSDDTIKVRKQAVFAISISKTDNLIPVLVNIAENNRETAIRKSAIFWLGQQASKKIAGKLEDICKNDPDYKIRKAAVFAISQHPDGVESLLRLVKTSKHLDVKKKAIFWLSQKDDERALEAIKTILNK